MALHTFTLDSGASRSFFRDSTTLTPLSRPVAVSLADPSGGLVLAHSSTVLLCPVAPSGLLSGLHLPSFSTNLVSGADLQNAWVDQFAPGGQRVTHCTCSQTGRHLATFTRWPGSSLYTLTTASPPVSVSGQVAASSQVFAASSRSSPASAPCSCRPLSHETLLWHHHLGHPSLPRLRGMASRTLVSGLPRSLHPLPPGPAPTYVPCVEGQQRAAPHSSTFPPTEAPLQTLHMDVWGPARVRRQGHEHYFLLVVDDYSRYTMVFPLRSKGEVPEMFRIPASPQQNGIAEHRIGMVMDVARTSMIHAATPHFLWSFAVQYAAHQINLQPRVSLLETTPTLSSTTPPRVVFCHLTASRLTSRCLTTVSFPTALPLSPPPPLFLAPGTPPVDPLPPQGPAPLGVSQVDPVEPVEVAVDFGAARGAEPERVEPGGAEPGGTASGGAEPTRAKSGGSPGVAGAGAAGGAARAGATRGAAGTGAAGGAAGAGAAGGAAGAGDTGGAAGVGAVGVLLVLELVVVLRELLLEPLELRVLVLSLLFLEVLRGRGRTTFRSFSRGLTERLEPESCPVSPVSRSASPVRTARTGHRTPRPPPVPGTHSMTLRPSIAPQRVPLPSPLAPSLLDGPDPESDSLCAACPTVTQFLAIAVSDPSFESTAASALVAELVAAMDAEMASWKSTGTYVDEVPLPGANIVSGMWIFRVKRPPGSPPVFKARYVARGFSQRQGVDFFHTFSPTPKMTTLRAPREWHDTLRMTLAALGFAPSTADPSLFLRTDTTLPPFYVLVYVDELVFTTADTEALAHVKSELQKRHTCTDLGELTSYLGLRITRDRAQRTITLTQSHMVQQVLQRFGFTYSSPQSTPLPTGHSLSAPPSDESVGPSGPYPELVGCLMYLMTCTRPDLAYPLSLLAHYVAPGRHRKVH
ncbi:unnamed protein product [Closterium sp. NIES-54]